MEPIAALEQYRQRLLRGLRDGAKRRDGDDEGLLGVFVNHACVGRLDFAREHPALVFSDREPFIHSVELRTESGRLVGGLLAGPTSTRRACIATRRHRIDVSVHNGPGGGSLRVACQAAPSLWHQVSRSAAALPSRVLPMMPANRRPAFGHAVIGILVLVLAADRAWTWVSERRDTRQGSASQTVTVTRPDWAEEFTRLQRQLDEVTKRYAAAADVIEAQRRDLGGLRTALADVAERQERLNAHVLTVQRDVGGQRKAVRKEVQTVTRLLMSRAADEREQLEAELENLSTANDTLMQEVEGLKHRNQELKNRLKAAGIDVSQAAPAAAGPSDVPRTELAQRETAEPFTFWVSFRDGVTEESIDRFVKKLHGRRGTVKAGWYPIEVSTPAPQPPTHLLDLVRQDGIVRAVDVAPGLEAAR